MNIIKFNKTQLAHTLCLDMEESWLIRIADKRFTCIPESGEPGHHELSISAEKAENPYELVLNVINNNGEFPLARLMYIPIAPLPPNQPH